MLTQYAKLLLILKQLLKLFQIDLGVEILKFQKVLKLSLLSIYNVPFWHVDRTSGTQLGDINYVGFFDVLAFFRDTNLWIVSWFLYLKKVIKLENVFLMCNFHSANKTILRDRSIHKDQTEYYIMLYKNLVKTHVNDNKNATSKRISSRCKDGWGTNNRWVFFRSYFSVVKRSLLYRMII